MTESDPDSIHIARIKLLVKLFAGNIGLRSEILGVESVPFASALRAQVRENALPVERLETGCYTHIDVHSGWFGSGSSRFDQVLAACLNVMKSFAININDKNYTVKADPEMPYYGSCATCYR
jgi:hypothetical protein